MNKTISRLLTFAIGLPLVIFLLWLPYINHLSLHIVVLVLSLLAANEMYNMLSLKSELQPKGFLLTLCGILSLISVIFSIGKTFFNWTWIQNELITFAFIIEFLLILIAEVFTSKDFEFSASRIIFGFIYNIFIYIYFTSCICKKRRTIDWNTAFNYSNCTVLHERQHCMVVWNFTRQE